MFNGLREAACPPCFAGETLPPVFCLGYTGRAGRPVANMRAWAGTESFRSGPLDAPEWIAAGSHRAPLITCGGKRVEERAHTIYAAEVLREGASQ